MKLGVVNAIGLIGLGGATGPMGPPCKVCNAYHNPLYDELVKAVSKENVETFFKIAITKHYAVLAALAGSKYNWEDYYYRDLIPLQYYVRGHYKHYADLFDRYMILK